MTWFYYFLFWAWPIETVFLHKLGQKMVIFRGFSKLFLRTTGFQIKLLKLIESSSIFYWKSGKKNQSWFGFGKNLGHIRSIVVKKSKETGISNKFFLYFTWGVEYLLKQKVVVVQTPEWKFKANIARNTTFEGLWGKIFPRFGWKMAKNWLFSRISLYFVSHKIDNNKISVFNVV